MTRFVPVTVLVVLLAGTRLSGAQTTTGTPFPSGAVISFTQREIFDPGSSSMFSQPDAGSTTLFHYFNLAHCNCARRNAGVADQTSTDHIGNFRYLVSMNMASGLGAAASADYWVGTNCGDMATRISATTTCEKIDSTPNIDINLATNRNEHIEFNLFQVINGKTTDPNAACFQSDSVSAPIYAFVQFPTSQPGTYDYQKIQTAGLLDSDTGMTAGVDTKPPPLPTNLKANPDENGIDLSWDASTGNNTDIVYFQALCATEDGAPARSQTDSPQYVTTAATCPGAPAEPADKVDFTVLENGEAQVTLSPALAALDAKYICGQQSSGTASSLSIKGLQNGVAYQVVLVAIDLHGNFAATYFDHTITPHAVTDFWESLHDPNGANSKVEGGLCLLAETYGNDSPLTQVLRAFRDDTLGGSRAGRWLVEVYYATLGKLGAAVHGSLALRIVSAALLAPFVAVALLWHLVGLPAVLVLFAIAWWLRRSRRVAARRARAWAALRAPLRAGSIAAVALFVLVGLGGRSAHAGGYQPYWENGEIDDKAKDEVPMGDPSLIEWHAGIRLGPYVPDVDGQTGKNPGAYAQMFGGYHMLPMLDVDRILWTGFGQVGVGVSLGYWQKTARPFLDNSSADDPNRPRAPGNKTAFRLLPLELSATYRLTMLDENYGIPVIPYVRGGFAYYIWWITAPNGNYARVCSDGGMEPSCAQNKALGASLGLQGAIGLSVRAERIDASAAMSMQNSGIQHAGIYGELSVAKVDGFGSDTKLSVGDTTWFAGVDFEF
jgi:hypothetical protein